MRTVLSLCNSRSHAAQLASAYRAVAHYVIRCRQHRALGGHRIRRIAANRVRRAGRRPLTPSREATRQCCVHSYSHAVSQPTRMITSSRNRASRVPCHSMVASRSLSARASGGWFSKHLEDAELGHVIGHGRLVGGGLGLAERQSGHAGCCHCLSVASTSSAAVTLTPRPRSPNAAALKRPGARTDRAGTARHMRHGAPCRSW